MYVPVSENMIRSICCEDVATKELDGVKVPLQGGESGTICQHASGSSPAHARVLDLRMHVIAQLGNINYNLA